ncbi:MAG: hypothetical protein JRJ69_02505 [Deltaproteobacteria bacterium]|nr:hypothetical protein [Deltaproteobacteria bacterium]MBW1736439.1 hypothetical protein [Deltaproteobacteria bacterium]MBW1909108.1 hypothetical protein [Deltaproteobacteria bacterium]MBW2032168.1 hypothetical protein [Deltaproteobacteria bacterium]MBW2113810.1 hypothetical protein [Deltaproteobacteria bacterium]
MNYLNAIFWDYPEFTDPNTIRRHLLKLGNQRVRRWLLKRFLEHGRVVDTLQFFRLDIISQELAQLNLRPYTYRKWKRITEVYAQSQGK